MPSELYVTPQGALCDEENTFAAGNGGGLLALAQAERPGLPPGKLYFRKIFIDRIRALAALGEPLSRDLSPFFEASRPTAGECALKALSAPPFVGAEYFDGALLERYQKEFEGALQSRFDGFSGTFAEFLRSLSPLWKDVGKVTFHLAENKGDSTGNHPFAFMASFTYRAGREAPKRLPLAAALKTYAGDSQAMTVLFAPIQRAAEKSEFIRKLVESRRIFQPSAWTAAEAYAFLKDAPLCEEANIAVRMTNLWRSSPPKAKVSVTLGKSVESRLNAGALLDFSVDVTLDGEKLTPEEIERILGSPGGLVRIRGQWVEAEPEKIAALLGHWQQAAELARREGVSVAEGLRLLAGTDRRSRGTAEVEDREYSSFEAGGEFKKMLDELRNPSSIQLPPLPDNLGSILRPYQLDGVKYLWRTSSLELGVCLADDMGLGKTLQLLTLVELWKASGVTRGLPVLLVLPATLLANWKNESAKFTPDLRIAALHSSAMTKAEWEDFQSSPEEFLSRCDVALVTYGMLARLPQLAKLEFPAVVADEAQAIKNPSAKQSRALRALHARRRIALTGTPVENRLADLWSLFDFINPGLLGNLKSFLDFTEKLENDYTPLRRLTQPFILRRLKTDKRIIADLPDKTEVKVYCGLTKKQAALYSRCVEEMRESIEGQNDTVLRRGVVLASLIRFKQICNHPAQYLGSGDYAPEMSGKFARLAELVESIASRQEKLLVFSQFREMTAPLAEFLKSCFGRDGLILHGGTPVKERSKLVEAFQRDGGPPFFVLSLKAAGVGLNLTAANHVVHFDRWWNPAVENQASDRAFRIGQKRNVLIHKFICRGTLEEKIDALMTDKQNLADEVLSQGAEKLLTSMSSGELLDFVKLDMNSLEM